MINIQNSPNGESPYKPEIKNVEHLAGLTLNFGKKGETIQVLQRAFLTSLNQKESKMMREMIRAILPTSNIVNDLLIVIRNGVATIHREFPLIMHVRMKEGVEAGRAVFKNQIIDIEGIQFKDTYFTLDAQDGDQFLWLFRNGFNFGLYFDFTKELKIAELSAILGQCYKNLEYSSICSYFKDSNNVELLFSKGWFPFIQLIGDDLENLLAVDSIELDQVSEILVEKFTSERLEKITKYWLKNSIFESKKRVIAAGISAFNANTSDGDINCISTLLPIIEGIMRISFIGEFGDFSKIDKLKETLLLKAKEKFSAHESFGFPVLFADYLGRVIFKKFDLRKGELDLSRNSVSHGVAHDDSFTRMRALQCILTLDQIYFYLGNDKLETQEKTL